MRNATRAWAAAAIVAVLAALVWIGPAGAGETAATVVSTLEVRGMTCGGCEAGVRAKVKRLEGVESVEASYKEGTARVVHDPTKLTPEQIVSAIEDLGYEAKLVETRKGDER